jgi:hypothetical protein
MTPPDANEKLTRRILGGLGVRPIGHQNPNDGEPGQVATAPEAPAQHGNRLPPWWEAKKPVADIDPQTPTATAGDPAAPVPPKPAAPPRDWLDDIINDNATEPEPIPEPDAEPDEEPAEAPAKKATPTPKTGRKKKQEKAEKPSPGAPRTAWDTRPASPRQSLLDAWGQVPPRLKWLMYHATAAYMGWEIGLVDYATYVTAWIAATGRIGAQAFFWYGVGAATYLLYRRSRAWGPAAWLAAVPLCSTVTGVLLHGYAEYHP